MFPTRFKIFSLINNFREIKFAEIYHFPTFISVLILLLTQLRNSRRFLTKIFPGCNFSAILCNLKLLKSNFDAFQPVMSGILVDIWWRSPFRVLLEDCGDHKGGRHYSRNAKCPHESRFPLWSFLSSQLYSRCQTLWCLRTMSRKHLYNIYSQKKPLNLHKTTFVKMRKEHKAASLIWCVFSTRKSSFFQLGRITDSRKIPKREIGIPKTRQYIICFK